MYFSYCRKLKQNILIYCVVEEAGGQCLPCVVDIRDEVAVKSAVENAVEKFGGIDILVNNASAISLTGTLATPMKRLAPYVKESRTKYFRFQILTHRFL